MSAMITISRQCPFCGMTSYLEVDRQKLEEYSQGGRLVQEVFPEMAPADREILITGMCYPCQNQMFGFDDEEDEDLSAEEFDMEEDGELWDEEFDDCDYEEGFDPYEGCYTYDC